MASGGGGWSTQKRSTFADRWEKSTSKAILQSVLDAVTLPGDVYRGEVDMMRPTMFQSITQTYDGKPIIRESATSDEAIGRAFDLAGTLTLGTGAVPAGANELRMGIKAFHGSPHSFDKFSSENIGTGEGVQAYGHGLYFAENQGVAADYQKKLAAKFSSINRSRLAKEAGADLGIASKYLPDQILKLLEEGTPIDQVKLAMIKDPLMRGRSPEDITRAVEYVKAKFPEHAAVKGSMYETEIAANPEDFLDWDKPLSEQPHVAERVKPLMRAPDDNVPGSVALDDIAKQIELSKGRGPLWGDSWADRSEVASQLRQAGIPGIRYLDQGSRTAKTSLTQAQIEGRLKTLQADLSNAEAQGVGDPARMREQIASLEGELTHFTNPTRNYVVFDDSLISILKKYGVVGPVLAALGLSQALPDRAEANAD